MDWHRPRVEALLQAGVHLLALETIPAQVYQQCLNLSTEAPPPTPPKEATPVIEDLLPSKNKKNSLLLRDISCKWATKTRNHPDLF